MIEIHRSLSAPAPTRLQIAPALWHWTAGEPMATSDARSSNGWRQPRRSPCVEPILIETAIRRGNVPAGTTYRATLTLHDRGRIDLTVMHRPFHIAVRLRCECAASYAWLVSHSAQLEWRLTSVLRHPSKVDVAYAG